MEENRGVYFSNKLQLILAAIFYIVTKLYSYAMGINSVHSETLISQDRLVSQDRVQSIDILRGVVMVIMALDHVREFWGPTSFAPEDMSQTSVPLFFTRWITHLCAPTFVFLSGVSIYFYRKRMNSRKTTSIFTMSRGLWLMLVEIAVVSFIVTQSYDIILLGVFWVIGGCMILMGGLIWLPRVLLIGLSVVMIAGHNLWPPINPSTPGEVIAAIFHNTPFFIPSPAILVTYTIIPWVGVMLAGYLIGPWFSYPAGKRNKLMRIAGVALLAVFVVLRLINGYGDPAPFSVQDRGWIYTALSFVNVTKYPPSLLFLCLTLGPGLIIISLLKNERTRVTEFFSVFGRVPFFFFVLHFALISLASYLWTLLQFGEGINLAFTQPNARPPEYTPDLLRVYMAWIIVVVATYFPCRWFSRYKKQNKRWWLSYL